MVWPVKSSEDIGLGETNPSQRGSASEMRTRTCAMLGTSLVTVLLAAALPRPMSAQDPPDLVRRMADLRAAGRPWRAAELRSADSAPAVVLAEAVTALA